MKKNQMLNIRHKVAKALRHKGKTEYSVPLCLCASVPDQKGLTLIEVMIVVAILAIMSSTLFSLFQGSLFSQRRGTSKALVYSEARATLEMMSREIEKAFVDERANIHYELWDIASPYQTGSIGDEFYFIAPMLGDVTEGVRLCGIGYWLKIDGTLNRYYDTSPELTSPVFDFSGGGGEALIGNVSDLQFQYWDGTKFADAPIGAPPNDHLESNTSLPRAVKITLVMEYEQEKDRTDTAMFTTVVNIPGSGQ